LANSQSAAFKRRAAWSDRVRQIVHKYRQSFPIVAATDTDLDQALLAHEQHKLPFWDAMIGLPLDAPDVRSF
jgi:predicted nucleic acid-binding protein